MADNIQVVVRIRPLNGRELSEGSRDCVNVSDEDCRTLVMESPPKPKKFAFDWVGGQETSQEDMFRNIGSQLVDCCVSGSID